MKNQADDTTNTVLTDLCSKRILFPTLFQFKQKENYLNLNTILFIGLLFVHYKQKFYKKIFRGTRPASNTMNNIN